MGSRRWRPWSSGDYVLPACRAPRPSTLQGEITRINTAIAELGAVNLAALEELNTSRERKGFLDSQSADLEEAVTTLEVRLAPLRAAVLPRPNGDRYGFIADAASNDPR